MRPNSAERAQATVELVAVVPLIVLAALVAAQLVAVGWTAMTAAEAARAGARASHVGGDAEATVRAVAGEAFGRPEVAREGAEVSVRLRAPRVLPFAPPLPVAMSAALDPAAGAR